MITVNILDKQAKEVLMVGTNKIAVTLTRNNSVVDIKINDTVINSYTISGGKVEFEAYCAEGINTLTIREAIKDTNYVVENTIEMLAEIDTTGLSINAVKKINNAGGGVDLFVDLKDTPSELIAGKLVAVNTTADSLELIDMPKGGGHPGILTVSPWETDPADFIFDVSASFKTTLENCYSKAIELNKQKIEFINCKGVVVNIPADIQIKYDYSAAISEIDFGGLKLLGPAQNDPLKCVYVTLFGDDQIYKNLKSEYLKIIISNAQKCERFTILKGQLKCTNVKDSTIFQFCDNGSGSVVNCTINFVYSAIQQFYTVFDNCLFSDNETNYTGAKMFQIGGSYGGIIKNCLFFFKRPIYASTKFFDFTAESPIVIKDTIFKSTYSSILSEDNLFVNASTKAVVQDNVFILP